jgi:hypothetical protein
MLKKILILLCLGAFIAVAAIGCGKKPANGEEKPEKTDETTPE